MSDHQDYLMHRWNFTLVTSSFCDPYNVISNIRIPLNCPEYNENNKELSFHFSSIRKLLQKFNAGVCARACLSGIWVTVTFFKWPWLHELCSTGVTNRRWQKAVFHTAVPLQHELYMQQSGISRYCYASSSQTQNDSHSKTTD